MKAIFSGFVFFFFTMTTALHAERLAQCGASEGYSYYITSPAVPADQSGWTPDKISSGSFSIIFLDEKVDILYTDASGITQSSLEEGAKITLAGMNEVNGSFSLLVQYTGEIVSVYTYNAPTNQLFYFTQQFGGLTHKSRVLIADCL